MILQLGNLRYTFTFLIMCTQWASAGAWGVQKKTTDPLEQELGVSGTELEPSPLQLPDVFLTTEPSLQTPLGE